MSNSECYIDFKDLGDKNPKDIIQKYGYAVITNVIGQDKSDQYIGDIWSWLENLVDASGTKSGIDRNNPDTWITYENALANGKTAYNWPKNSYGIISNHGISHANFVWKARCEPNIKQIYSKIWDSTSLITSFDGACVMLPPSISKTTNTKSWFHFDQSPKSPEFCCVQGFLNLENSGDEDGCLMVYPRSNHYHKKFFDEKNLTFDSDWYAFNDTNKGDEWMESQGLKPIKVTAPKGSFVLWDSRTVHCSCLPTSNNIRYCIYVCMLPTHRATTSQLIEKKDVFQKRLGTSHWPHKNEIVHDESVLFDRDDSEPQCLKYINNDDLKVDDKVLSLVGYDTHFINHIINDLNYLKEKFKDLQLKISETNVFYQNYLESLSDFDNYYKETMIKLYTKDANLPFIKSANNKYFTRFNILNEL